MNIIPLVITLFISTFSLAAELDFDTTSDNTIEIKTFEGDGENLLIYLPSHRGLGNTYSKWATELGFEGFDTWAIDLYASYMLSHSKSNMAKFSINDLVEVVNFANTKEFKNVYFVTSGRGAQLALKTAYAYQKKYNNNILKGHIFHSPHLIEGSAEIGDEASYAQITSHSNLPIHIMVSDSSTKFIRLKEISELLQAGGSSVSTQIFKGISAGFYMKPNSRLTNKDRVARNNLSSYYSGAIKHILSGSKIGTLKLIQAERKKAKTSHFKTSLTPLNIQAKPLTLTNLDNQVVDLAKYKNKVVLINFWASWCNPCVKEIPSLIRLRDKINSDDFEILAVNIGESKSKILKFKQKLKREQQVNFNLPILFDEDGSTTREWKIYAYPSNYIVDKNGVIKYGYRGALEWDREDVVETINRLINTNTAK